MKTSPAATKSPWQMPARYDKIYTIPVEAIEVEENFNPRRFDTPEMRERIEDLKNSIRVQGVIKELLVRQDRTRVILVGGETRLIACRELVREGHAIKGVPAKFVKAMDAAARVLLALTDNTGRPLTQLEAGGGYARLAGYGWATDQIAEAVGQPKRYVTESIALTDVPVEVKQLVAANLVTASRALAEVREHGSASVVVLAEKVRAAQACGGRRMLRREKRDSPTVGRLKKATQLLIRAAGDLAKYDMNLDLLNEIECFVTSSAGEQ